MPRYIIRLRGSITREFVHRECDAYDEEHVREICAEEMPNYRVHSIALAKHIDGCPQKDQPSEDCICEVLETD
jgi:hypothetical protein